MKRKISLFGLFILMLFINACVKDKSIISTGNLSDEDKKTVTNEIMELTTNWVNSNKNMDPDKTIEFWDSSDSLMFAENGAFFPSRDSIHAYLKSFYTQTKNMDVEWGKRVIVPLSKKTLLPCQDIFISRQSLRQMKFLREIQCLQEYL